MIDHASKPPSLARQVMQRVVDISRGDPPPNGEALRQLTGQAQEVSRLPAAQLRAYVEQAICGPAADVALQWLHDAGVLAELLPELEATVDFTQEMGRRHKDVWKHTKQVLIQAPERALVRWAALLHDIGKVPTRILTPAGKVTFHGHPEVGARMFDRIARRLAFPTELRHDVRFLIYNHLRASQYDSGWTDSAVRRFDREMGDHLPALLDLSRADITSARRHKVEAARAQICELEQRMAALREIDTRVPPLPSGLGNHIIGRFELEPGRIVGRLMATLAQAVADGELEPQQEPQHYLDYLERNDSWRE